MDTEMNASSESQSPNHTQPTPTPDDISGLKPRYPVPDPEPIPTPVPSPHPHNPTTQAAFVPDDSAQAHPLHQDEQQAPREPTVDPQQSAADVDPAGQEPEPEPTHDDPHRPHTGRYQPSHPAYRLSRFQLRKIASTTLRRIELGYYIPPSSPTRDTVGTNGNGEAEAGGSDAVKGNGKGKGKENSQVDDTPEEDRKPIRRRYDLAVKVDWTNAHTTYWAPDAPELGGPWDVEEWSGADLDLDEEMDAFVQPESYSQLLSTFDGNNEESQMDMDDGVKRKTRILVKEYSTLVGARKLHNYLREHPPASGNTTIGVLNFASAKRPGGGFIQGAQAQEESIARASTLYPSLISEPAKPFYAHYTENPSDAFYTHAMVYSPRVVIFRNDRGAWMRPVEVDVLTCAAVNAGEVRRLEKEARVEMERAQQDRIEWEEQMGKLRDRVRKAEAARELRRREEEEAGENGTEIRVRIVSRKLRPSGHVMDRPTTPEGDIETTSASEPTFSSRPSSPAATAFSSPRTTELELQPETELESEPEPESKPELIDLTATSPTPPPAPAPEPEPEPTPLRTAQETERLIASTMYTRIARILALFKHANAQHLVLGSFGTGVFQNHIPVVAHAFWDLLCRDGAPFAGAFESVVFAILGSGTVRVFREVFGVAAGSGEGGGGGDDEVDSDGLEEGDVGTADIGVDNQCERQDGADGSTTVQGADAPSASEESSLPEKLVDMVNVNGA
ncbi:hypothetical protein JR316_0001830 [Psilocybe cubensis]|uniref:Uncharacterized protein n=2 Tax=Psilocybe cubensis TaxID=181762 RepID=A0ACB8HBA4_PSICU|nr:hypothetical protein JR316_0001830 [Psilocybe cubensis]KAH9484927.1 hypothetical protein JR316_0001830 [Psilocybe cubensis]